MDEFTPQELARLADYFAQELHPDEVSIVEGWITGQPDLKKFVQELQLSRLGLGRDSEHAGPRCPSAAIEAISQNLAQTRAAERFALQGGHERGAEGGVERGVERDRQYSDGRHAGTTKRMSRSYAGGVGSLSRLSRPMFSVVVSCVLLIVVGWFSFKHSQSSADSVEMTTYETANGERATVTLPDGSVITLNVGSQLQVPVNYSDNNRTLTLVGEALFTVTHKGKVPFTVISGPSVTRVLGTQFAVRHYPKDDWANIAVQDGKVSVGDKVLSAGQQLSMNDKSDGIVQSVDANRFDFADGILMLDRVLLREAIPELNRWYNADIRLGDPALASRKIVGGFKLGSLTDLVAILELTFDVRVVRDANTLTLYSK